MKTTGFYWPKPGYFSSCCRGDTCNPTLSTFILLSRCSTLNSSVSVGRICSVLRPSVNHFCISISPPRSLRPLPRISKGKYLFLDVTVPSCCHVSFFSFFIYSNHGKPHAHLPPFSLFMQSHCLRLPTATQQKKKKLPPRERVAIATTFSKATSQIVSLSYMLRDGDSSGRRS